jgi:hypothetical protein
MKESLLRQSDLEIIAGPCQISPENLHEIYDMADIRVADGKGGMQRAIWGARVVGLKSRTDLDKSGKGMGIDFSSLINENVLIVPDILPPSVQMSKDIVYDTDLLVATEVMIPHIQMPMYEQAQIPAGHLLSWNPSVDQLGWHVKEISDSARRNGWLVGLKNGKSIDTSLYVANDPMHSGITSLEKQWLGLASYARDMNGSLILIHRGVESPEKGQYRNAPVHEVAKRVKNRVPEAKLYFDPSHSLGPNLRNSIVEETIRVMQMKNGNGFLYDGILVESGSSESDTNQHITLQELEGMVKELARFRKLRTPEPAK